MKVKIEALEAFSHYALLAAPGAGPLEGGLYSIAKGEAQELEKKGLVRIVGDDEEVPQTGVTDSQDDLLGGEKMADDVQNKMEPAPANKAPAKSKKH